MVGNSHLFVFSLSIPFIKVKVKCNEVFKLCKREITIMRNEEPKNRIDLHKIRLIKFLPTIKFCEKGKPNVDNNTIVYVER